MGVIEMRGFAVESFAAVLLFIGALGEADMGLAGEFAFFEGVHEFRIAEKIGRLRALTVAPH